MQIRLKGKNIYAKHHNKYEPCLKWLLFELLMECFLNELNQLKLSPNVT